MFLHVANDIPLLIGDIMNWKLDDGTVEKWLVHQEEKKTNPSYRTFLIIRCNYLIKWVDQEGHVQQSWSYVTSSLDSMIKDNFRTWNSVITPQPNKYAELLLPRRDIHRSTNFLIEGELWKTVDFDHTSVPGVIYVSLTEGKVNSLTDDVENNLADTDRIAKYELSMPTINQVFNLGDHIEPVYTLMKNGKICKEEVVLDTTNKKVARFINDTLIAVGKGTTDLIAYLKDYPDIKQTITITVGEEVVPDFAGYIEGIEKLKLNRATTYILKGNAAIEGSVQFRLEETELASIIDFNDISCVVKSNDKNKLGSITLIASYAGVDYIKNISIIPLW